MIALFAGLLASIGFVCAVVGLELATGVEPIDHPAARLSIWAGVGCLAVLIVMMVLT